MGKIVFHGKRKRELYFLESQNVPGFETNIKVSRLEKWHQCMAASSAESAQEKEFSILY